MNVKSIWEGAGKVAREIVAKRVMITTVVGLIAGYVVAQGWVTPDLSQTVQDNIAAALTLIGAITGVLWARNGVTPADPAKLPTSSNNLPLVEAVLDLGDRMPGKPQPIELPHNAPQHAAPTE